MTETCLGKHGERDGMNSLKVLYSVLLVIVTMMSCKSIDLPMQSGNVQSFKNLDDYIKKSPTLQTYFFGMQLYDMVEGSVLYEHHADQYFTPASNTKLLTLYAATHYLEDSLVWMEKYRVNGQTVFRPMGDPSFLHPNLPANPRLESYFTEFAEDTVRFTLYHFRDRKFGPGWAWNDYADSYQTEKSPFPVHSNLIKFSKEPGESFPDFLAVRSQFNEENRFARDWSDNIYYLNDVEEQWIPFHVDSTFYARFFDSYQKKYEEILVDVGQAKPLERMHSYPVDSVYKEYMHSSDNHTAEQLLLQASQLRLGYMNTDSLIAVAQKELFTFTPDSLLWADGSGLSRYNLFTPRSLVSIINQLAKEKGINWLQGILAAGGQSGTIQNYYAYDPPRVFAKTGTLRNNHCLSGIVLTNSGKWLSFSMMNNHYDGGSSIAKAEMENILKLIIEMY